MLYTVTPLERIYTDRTKPDLQPEKEEEKSTEVERRSFDVENGKVYTRKAGKEYIIEGIQSTDMKDYLNPQYSPGNNFPCN